MLWRLDNCIRSLEDPNKSHPHTPEAVAPLLDTLKTARAGLLHLSGDHPTLRFGQEVILAPEDMPSTSQSQYIGLNRPDQPLSTSGKGVRAQEDCDLDIAGWTYCLHSPARIQEGIEQFEKDMMRNQTLTLVTSPDNEEKNPVNLQMPPIKEGTESEEVKKIRQNFLDETSQAIQNFFRAQGHTPDDAKILEDSLKTLSSQSTLSFPSMSLSIHLALEQGIQFSPGSGMTQHYEIQPKTTSSQKKEGIHVYNLSMEARTRDPKNTVLWFTDKNATMPANAHPEEGSYIGYQQTFQLTFNEKTRQIDLAFAPDGQPSFEYHLEYRPQPDAADAN
jgi:hypothetical protein